jgi:cytoskeleton protein RodZ
LWQIIPLFWARKLSRTKGSRPSGTVEALYRPGVRFACQVCVIPAGTSDASGGHQRNSRFVDGATFGAFLQNHRVGRNLSLQDIAAQTKIAGRYLAALERGDIRSWPGGIYRRAMVRAYAAAIGLDPDATVRDFLDAFNEAPPEMQLDTSGESPSLRDLANVRPRASIYLGLVMCAAIVALVWAAAGPSDAAGAIADAGAPVSTIGDRAALPPAASGTAGRPIARREPARPAASEVADIEPDRPVATVPAPQPAASPAEPTNVEGAIRIVSEPAGAQVTVNGIGRGQTPITVRHLGPGEKRLRISKEGYRSAERRLLLTHDHPAPTVRVALQVDPKTGARLNR